MRNEGGSLLDKKLISARIPNYVYVYCKQKSISFSELCMKGFDFFRATDRKHPLVVFMDQRIEEYQDQRKDRYFVHRVSIIVHDC